MSSSLAVLVLFAAMMSACARLLPPPGGVNPGPVTTVPSPTTTAPVPTGTGLAIRVSGNHFVDRSGHVVQLRGVNRASTEYRCTWASNAGFATSDVDADGTSANYVRRLVSSLTTWDRPGATTHAVNTVRIPLNEDCWLGINGAAAAYSGSRYQSFIRSEVEGLIAQGMYPILDLHWSAPGGYLATQQDVAPNADHSTVFWQQVAAMFKSSPAVMFDLMNEPRIWCFTAGCSSNYSAAVQAAWGCYRDGCNYTYRHEDWVTGRESGSFKVAGTQQLVNLIRGQGAQNVILIEGLGYANALDNWMRFKPKDPAGQIAAEVHTYPSSGANITNPSWLDNMLGTGGLSTSTPIVVGEFGEWMCNAGSSGFTEKTMTWADQHGYSYVAWGWDKGEGCNGPSLVSSNDSGAASTYGTIVKSHLQRLER